ncbi:MAG TPA: hypothetical protein VFS43_38230 [Polyangiaceae bacterium]|nr:hypothetical protein [Polyangiaceae bacterium]
MSAALDLSSSADEALEGLSDLALLYGELARLTGDAEPVTDLAGELRRARGRLAVDWAAKPRGWLARTLQSCAARLVVASEAHPGGRDAFLADVGARLPAARRLAAAMRPDTLAVATAGAAAKRPEGAPPGWHAAYVCALLVAGLERLPYPATDGEAAQ